MVLDSDLPGTIFEIEKRMFSGKLLIIISSSAAAAVKVLIKQAIEHELKKEDFLEYRNYIKFQNWMKEQNRD